MTIVIAMIPPLVLVLVLAIFNFALRRKNEGMRIENEELAAELRLMQERVGELVSQLNEQRAETRRMGDLCTEHFAHYQELIRDAFTAACRVNGLRTASCIKGTQADRWVAQVQDALLAQALMHLAKMIAVDRDMVQSKTWDLEDAMRLVGGVERVLPLILDLRRHNTDMYRNSVRPMPEDIAVALEGVLRCNIEPAPPPAG